MSASTSRAAVVCLAIAIAVGGAWLAPRRAGAQASADGMMGADATLTLAQSPQTQTLPTAPTFRAGVNVVQIDVSVLDADRRPVRGLTAADFTVLEEGKPREIVAFTPVDLPPAVSPDATPAAAWTRDVAPDVTTNEVPAEGRLVVIAFDWSIRFQDSQLARRIAIETVNTLGPGDQAAVVFTSGFANAGVPQNFTADRERLLAAINQPMAFALQGLDVILPQVGGFISQNGVMLEDPSGYASGDCRCRVCSLEAMTRIANTMRPVTGRRKLMIFIGTHFRGYESPIPVPRQTMRGLPPPPPGPSTQFLIPDSQGAGTCSAPLRDARREMERATALANMTVHVIDPVGLETLESSPLGGASPDTIRTRIDGLHLPADLTGGRTVLGTNTPEAALPDILAESQSYYLLGFLATDGAESARLRRIEVKVNRRGVQVRARSGYFGNEEAAARGSAAASTPLLQSVEGTLPRTGVPLALVAAPFGTSGRRTGSVALVLSVQPQAEPGGDPRPAASPGGRRTMHMAVAALDPKARVVATREQTVEFTTAANTADQTRTYEVLSRLELSPGRYEIRVAADAETGERGSVFTFVDVPDFLHAPFTVSGISVSAQPAAPVAPAGLFADLMPATPTARRDFARTDEATAFMRIHQAAVVPVAVTVFSRILDRAGRVVLEDTQTFPADRFGEGQGVDYQVSLPLARLEASDYLLAIQVATPSTELRRNVRFTVR